MSITKDGLGYCLRISGSDYYIDYNFRGYKGFLQLPDTSLLENKTFSGTDDISGKPFSVKRWIIKNHAGIVTLLLDEIQNNVINSVEYKKWGIETRYPNANESGGNFTCDSGKVKFFADEKSVDEKYKIDVDIAEDPGHKVINKEHFTTPDGQIVIMEDL